MRAYALLLLFLTVAAVLAGCGRDEEVGDGIAAPSRVADVTDDGYSLVMLGVISDTLSGRAQFGDVYDTYTRQVTGVIELVTTADFAGGFFITPGEATWPGVGTHSINNDDAGDGFVVIYRQGLHRAFRARSGSLTLSVVSDTLIRGRFEAVMTGEVAERGREPVSGDINVVGSFSARPGQPGYIIGL